MLVISYRHIKQKNLELEIAEKEIYFAEVEKQRQQIYEKMYRDHAAKEIEINEHLKEREDKLNDLQVWPNQILVNEIDGLTKAAENVHHDDSTDDEFFEMPLPPIPTSPNERTSIDENEDISAKISLTAVIHETPKVDNTSSVFLFPSPTRPAPPIPFTLMNPPAKPTSTSIPISPLPGASALTQPASLSNPPKAILQSDL